MNNCSGPNILIPAILYRHWVRFTAIWEILPSQNPSTNARWPFKRKIQVRNIRDTARTLSGLGLLYMNMGDYEKATPMVQRALAIDEKVFGPEHPAVAIPLGKLEAIYEKGGNFVQADSSQRDLKY